MGTQKNRLDETMRRFFWAPTIQINGLENNENLIVKKLLN